MGEIKTRETMWAEMRPDCYGGKTCDQIVPRWHIFCSGDKDSENTREALKLAPRTFPPGTRVVIHEPVCPRCGDTRSVKYPTPKRGPLFDDNCECGFDWKNWTLGEYS